MIVTGERNARQTPEVVFDSPSVRDGPELWRLAVASRVLDVNSRYAYLLWCRDFASTSVVARLSSGTVAGFVTGYRRPEEPNTLVVWQITVDAALRGRGIASQMLDELLARVPDTHYVETTITPGNTTSQVLFTKFAQRNGALINRRELFSRELLGETHEPEVLYRIGPISGNGAR